MYQPTPYKDNLKRDQLGYRVGLKIIIRQKLPMSDEGWRSWGKPQQIHISKSRFIWRYYASSRSRFPNGIPLEYLKTDKAFGIFLINNFLLAPNEVFAIHGWTHKKTKFRRGGRGVGFTKKIFEIHVHDVERLTFTIRLSKMNKYWFRKQEKERRKSMWGN